MLNQNDFSLNKALKFGSGSAGCEGTEQPQGAGDRRRRRRKVSLIVHLCKSEAFDVFENVLVFWGFFYVAALLLELQLTSKSIFFHTLFQSGASHIC